LRPWTATPTIAQSIPRLVNFWNDQAGEAGFAMRISVSSSPGASTVSNRPRKKSAAAISRPPAGPRATSVASRIESLFLNGCLLPGTAAIAGILRMPCVVGKSILVSRTALEVAGGFPALQNYLAEDYLIGREVRRAGYRVVLSADIIDTLEVNKTARAVWDRHRRWALMRRRLGGGLYLAEAFSGALPWAVAASAAGGWFPAAFLLAARYALEGRVADAVGRPHSTVDRLLLPVRDLAAAAVFVAGLLGRSVRWRGRDLSIGRDTRIVRSAA